MIFVFSFRLFWISFLLTLLIGAVVFFSNKENMPFVVSVGAGINYLSGIIATFSFLIIMRTIEEES